jgi:hypothetical protein
MPDKPSGRRWFRFSLRTLLVLVTVVACWLGWESSVVRGRKQLVQEMELRPGVRFLTSGLHSYHNGPPVPPQRAARVSQLRQWLGDKAIQEIEYQRGFHNLTADEIATLARTFPEAKVHETEPLMEPCHPGCFPRGTLVETPAGSRPIVSIVEGDVVTAFLASGEQVTAAVQSVFITDNQLWQITTEDGELLTTETQPLCLATDQVVPAGELQVGDEILRYTGGELRSVRVMSLTPTGRVEQVINLVLGDNQLFIAGGYLARSKPPRES